MASLSIIIPTKNRYTYLFPVLTAITSQIKRADLEIIVQDNSDDNTEAIEFMKKLGDFRVKYFYQSGQLPISDNTEMAIENSTKEFVVFIGDDDFVAPCICKVVDAMQERGIEALTYDCGYYWWESVVFATPSPAKQKKAFWIPKTTLSNHQFLKKDSKLELKKVLKLGAVIIGDMPRFYHGIVNKKLLEDIKIKCGRYLIASCPDICFSISLAIITESYYHLNYPVTIYGASKDSAAGLGARNAHYAELKDLPFLRSSIINNWNKNIPFVWSPATIYAQSTSEVLAVMNHNEKINYGAMYVFMLKNERNLMPYIKPAIRRYFAHYPLDIFKAINYIIIKILTKKYSYTLEDVNTVQILDTVDDCMTHMPELSFK